MVLGVLGSGPPAWLSLHCNSDDGAAQGEAPVVHSGAPNVGL